MAEFKERLQQILEQKKMKAIRLSEMTGIDRGTISAYLNGKYKASQNNLYLIAKALNVSEPWLMGHDVPMERVPDDARKSFDNASAPSHPTYPEFKTAQEAIKYILEFPMVAQFGGYNLDEMTDQELIDMANLVAQLIRGVAVSNESKGGSNTKTE